MDGLINHLMDKPCGDECLGKLRTLEAELYQKSDASDSKACTARRIQNPAINVCLSQHFPVTLLTHRSTKQKARSRFTSLCHLLIVQWMFRMIIAAKGNMIADMKVKTPEL